MRYKLVDERITVRSEAPPPVAKRLGIMQPKHLDISRQQTGTFDCRHHLAQRRAIGAGEDVFVDPRIVDSRTVPLTDAVQQRHAVRLQAAGDRVEEGAVVEDPGMLEMPTETMRSKL
jgi:hypothetical protein